MIDLRKRIVAGAIFPLQERLKRHTTMAVWRSLEASQWWSAERIDAERLRALQTLVLHAAATVPFYRDMFRKAGFDPAGVRSIEDIRALPLLSKDVVRSNLDSLKSTDDRRLHPMNTGGSTGEPLIFFLSDDRISHDVAAKRRATRWWNVDIGDPEIVVWGSPIETTRQDRAREWRDRLMRTKLLSAFEMSPTRMDVFVKEIRRRCPKMLFGYPSALDVIARHANSRGWRLDDLGIRVAFVTAEMLYEHQRETIGRVFGCPVANGYGGRDAGFIAHQCPFGSMHVTAEDVILETVNPEGGPVAQGEIGELVVTHLYSFGFPFIRYRTGDLVRLGGAACPCGRGLPVLREIQGRSTDLIVLPDGTRMHGLALVYVVRDLPGIEQFRIEQEAIDRITVRIVRNDAMPKDVPERIRSGFERRLGAGVNVTVELVPELAPARSGKHRYVTSRVT